MKDERKQANLIIEIDFFLFVLFYTFVCLNVAWQFHGNNAHVNATFLLKIRKRREK